MRNSPPIFDAVIDGGRVVSSYRRLLQSMLDAGLTPVLYREYADKSDMRNILLLRHDVVSNLEAAVNLAAINFQIGIRATFFLLPPGDHRTTSNYYGRILFGRVWHSRKLLAAARQISSYGHEIGLHNDFAQLSYITRRPVAALLQEEIAWFRSHSIPICGSASRGSGFANKNNFVNYEIFKGCERRGVEAGRTVSKEGWEIKLHEVDMGELGLAYEAYFLARDVTYSDSKKKVVLVGTKQYKDGNSTLVTDDDFQNLTTVLKGVKDTRCVALIHPHWWTFSPFKTDGAGGRDEDSPPATAVANLPADEPREVTLPGLAVKRMPRDDAGQEPVTLATSQPAQASIPLSVARAFVARNPLPSTPAQSISMLPFEYIQSFYETLLEDDRVNFLDFNDLRFSPDQDIRTEEGLATLYAEEYRIWRKRSLSGIDAPKLNLLIQHDSDSAPLETQYVCAFEGELGIKSTTAIFCRELDRGGVIRSYDIDYGLLKRLQAEKGMCFAYHCNAGELAGYDEQEVANVFNADVEFLRLQGLDIRFFSPHGGATSPTGVNNYSFFYPSFSRHRLIWTHNRFAPGAQRYSDGGWMARMKRGDAGLDLRKFLTTNLSTRNRPLTYRYFVLLHPQYYFAKDSTRAEPHFHCNLWLKEFWDLHLQGRASDFWRPFRETLLSSFTDG